MHISKAKIEKMLDETIREALYGVALIPKGGVYPDSIVSQLKCLGYWWPYYDETDIADVARLTIHNGAVFTRGTITYDSSSDFLYSAQKSYRGSGHYAYSNTRISEKIISSNK